MSHMQLHAQLPIDGNGVYTTTHHDPFTAYTGIGADPSSPTGVIDQRDPRSREARSTGKFSTHAEYGEVEPPSYDDVTGGQQPTHIRYVIPR